MANQARADRDELLEQQRALAEIGGFALETGNLDSILNQACRLVGRGLSTHLAKAVQLHSGGRTMHVRAGVGWRPGVVGEVTFAADDNVPEGLTLKEGRSSRPTSGKRRASNTTAS